MAIAEGTITLTTDFGTTDWFVGTMKGVIAQVAPGVRVVDLTHGIPPGDIRAGAFALAAGCRFFPKGTIHVAVVDPGVGSARQALAVRTEHYWLVGPDNGVLSWAAAKERVRAVHALENRSYFLGSISRTFHGRDIFAPVAAHLARGVPIRKLGRALEGWVRLPWPAWRQIEGGVEGEVVYVDGFGNAITNLDEAVLQGFGQARPGVWQGRKRLCELGSCYQAVPHGRAIAVLGSSGFLEIALNGGNAAGRLGLRSGSRIQVRASKLFHRV